MAALGAETSSGDFEVIEYCFAGLPPQPALKPAKPDGGEWVAIASGLEMGSASDAADVRTEMLVEYLLGEAGEAEVRAVPFFSLRWFLRQESESSHGARFVPTGPGRGCQDLAPHPGGQFARSARLWSFGERRTEKGEHTCEPTPMTDAQLRVRDAGRSSTATTLRCIPPSRPRLSTLSSLNSLRLYRSS